MTSPMPDAPNQSGARRALGALLFVLVVAAAVGVAWWATRGARGADATAAAGGMAGHDHATMGGAPAGDAPKPVEIPARDARRIGVTYAVATDEPVSRELRVVGELAVDETRQRVVALKVDGFVERLFVDFTGRAVRAGEPMAAVYSPMLVSAQEELLLAHKLARGVGDAAGAGAEAARDARGLIESARRRLRLWDVPEATIRRVEATGEVQRTVTFPAPASGVVVDKPVVAGQQVMAGTPLLRLADLSVVWLEGEVFEQDLPAVRVGQGVDAEFRALPGETFKGRVSYVYPTLDPETRTARVRVSLPNGEGRLRPGMYATLRLQAAGRAGVVSVPRSAVLTTGDRSLVFVRRADGKLEPHLVVLGAASDDRIEVLRGIAAGDTVVASATFLVDAESNLGSMMGGMGDMPGMDMTAPVDRRGEAPGARGAPGGGAGSGERKGAPAGGRMPAAPNAHGGHGGHQ